TLAQDTTSPHGRATADVPVRGLQFRTLPYGATARIRRRPKVRLHRRRERERARVERDLVVTAFVLNEGDTVLFEPTLANGNAQEVARRKVLGKLPRPGRAFRSDGSGRRRERLLSAPVRGDVHHAVDPQIAEATRMLDAGDELFERD